MPQDLPTGAVASAAVERLIKQLNIAWKAVKLYPISSNIPRESARSVVEALRRILESQPVMRIEVAKDGFVLEGEPLYAGQASFSALAREFYNRNIAEIRFHAGCTEAEVIHFLSVLLVSAEELSASGGFETRLWDAQVNNITVKEVTSHLIDARSGAETTDSLPSQPAEVDDLVVAALTHRPRAQRILVRYMADTKGVEDYLGAPSMIPFSAQGATVARRVSDLARAVRSEAPEQRQELTRSVAEGLRSLDAELLRDVMNRLLNEARHDESVETLLREFSLEEFCSILIAGSDLGAAEAADLSRTVRNLVALGTQDRDEVLGSVADSMRSEGAAPALITEVMEESAPDHLRVRERTPVAGDKPVELIMRLLDVAGANVAASANGADGVESLREEALSGISDGDIMGALVLLVTLESRADPFATVMSLMENNLGLLVERQDFAVAADAAEALTAAETRPDLTADQRARIHATVAGLSEPATMRRIVGALRMHRADTDEHRACRRLLTVLGDYTIGPLLEVLANEKDMAARKSLVDLISGIADEFIDELGKTVGDARWYFVRNVVSILGSTRRLEALPYLERTIRYPDPRVRRETIRAASGIRDAGSSHMLIASLEDDDAGNVQLAARYLGTMRAPGAVPALEQVALGEGRGNRDSETRVEAIEALGRIGEPSSARVLGSLARQRLLSAGRNREVRVAAEEALSSLRDAGREGEQS